HPRTGSTSRATAGSPKRPTPSDASVTPSWTVEMYGSMSPEMRDASFARALPVFASSSSWVPRTRTNEYSAATKKPFTNTRMNVRMMAAPASIPAHSGTEYTPAMRVVVRLFASYREAAGVGRIELELPPGAQVQDAIAEIVSRHPLIAEGRSVVIARNREYVTAGEPLADGDEVALIPPVSGGAMSTAPIMVSASRLSVDDALEAVRDAAFGGVVVFLGTVRDRSRGKRVTHLEYEAYAEMAEGKMRE